MATDNILRYKGNENLHPPTTSHPQQHKYAPTLFSLDTSNLSLNTPYTYKALTTILSQPQLQGSSKTRQLLEFSRFFHYERVGTKFIITTIYKTPLSYLPITQKDGKYNTLMMEIILSYLHNKAQSVFYLTHMDFVLICGLANKEFKRYGKEYDELKEKMGISLPQITDFYSSAYRYFRNIIKTALSSMEGRCMLMYVDTYVIYKRISHNNYKLCEATDEEVVSILEMQHQALQELGLGSTQELWYKPSYREKYKKRVEEIMHEKFPGYWEYFYKTIKIFSSPTMLYTEINSEAAKQELNSRIFSFLHDQAIKNFASLTTTMREEDALKWLEGEEKLQRELISL